MTPAGVQSRCLIAGMPCQATGLHRNRHLHPGSTTALLPVRQMHNTLTPLLLLQSCNGTVCLVLYHSVYVHFASKVTVLQVNHSPKIEASPDPYWLS